MAGHGRDLHRQLPWLFSTARLQRKEICVQETGLAVSILLSSTHSNRRASPSRSNSIFPATNGCGRLEPASLFSSSQQTECSLNDHRPGGASQWSSEETLSRNFPQ